MQPILRKLTRWRDANKIMSCLLVLRLPYYDLVTVDQCLIESRLPDSFLLVYTKSPLCLLLGPAAAKGPQAGCMIQAFSMVCTQWLGRQQLISQFVAHVHQSLKRKTISHCLMRLHMPCTKLSDIFGNQTVPLISF